MTAKEKIQQIQSILGVTPDGQFGPKSRAALEQLIAEAAHPGTPSNPTPAKMRVAIDAGHGLSNRSPGVFDSGCEHNGLQEANVTLKWSEELFQALQRKGIPAFQLRTSNDQHLPVAARATRAKDNGATHYISIHVNDAGDPAAHGSETLYQDSQEFALRLNSALARGLQLRDRGIKQRSDLAVLRFKGPTALMEVGFIKNNADVAAFTDAAKIRNTCDLIAASLLTP